jgi:predicted nucleic acid-binding protein
MNHLNSVIISSKSNICRDPKDNYLVSLALDSKADFLITGDKDLLELNKISETIVLKYTDFDTFISTIE